MNEYVTNLILKNAETSVDPDLKKFRDEYREKGIPTLLTESLNCLVLMATLKKPVKILEFGTSVGCSGIALLKASENATLYTIERYEKAFYEAKENFEKFGLSDRVKQFNGDALDMVDEVGEGFDFVFLDCNKSKYKDLYPKIKQILVKGGILFADNVLFRGYIT
ncbi:MAG: O-methyltransferase, partial [Clostridia bacterium]|nr:O-methyltransferase [Clostridia bacterium]